MTVKRAKIQIDVEATTEGAVRGMDRVAAATEKSRKAVEKNDAALKAARLEYQVAQARAENLAAKLKAFTAAEDRATAAVRRHHQALQSQKGATDGSGSSLLGLAGSAAKAGGALAAAGVVVGGLALQMVPLAEESLRVQGVFQNLPYDLNAAKEASRGLADDMTLARYSIMANQAGVAKTSEEYAKLVGTAQTLALKMGRDVNDTIERVTLGIAKQEREILDELVVLPRMEEMWTQYATTLGKTTAELTDQEKTAAFTRSALDALAKATQGVDTNMVGLASSIAKTAVEAKNLRTELLGGGIEPKIRTLAEGVRTLDAAMLRNVASIGGRDGYGESFRQVSGALQEAGVDVSAFRNQNDKLEAAIRKVLETEKRQLTTMAERGQLTMENVADIERLQAVKGLLNETDERLLHRDLKRLDLENERERVAARAAAGEVARRNERIMEIEEQLAFGRGAQIAQSELNALVAEEAELRAQVLEAEGKLEEAAEVRRKAQLAALEQLGETTRPRGGGGRRRDRSAERAREQQEQAERMRATWETHNALANAIRAKRAADAETLRTAAAQDLEIELDNVIDFEERRAQVVLAGRLREIETIRQVHAAKVWQYTEDERLALEAAEREDRRELRREKRALRKDIAKAELRTAFGFRGTTDEAIAALDAESRARMAALEAEESILQHRAEREMAAAEAAGDMETVRRLQAQQDLDRMELQDRRESELHDAHLARLEARRAAEEAVHERRVQIGEESMGLALGAAQAIVQGAVIEGKSLRAVVAATAKSEAMRHGLILGPSALAAAGFHFAVGNIPQGTALLASAGQSFAFAASMAALGAAVGAFGGGGRGKEVRGGFGAGAFGPGADAGAANAGTYGSQRSASGGSWDIGGAVPLSLDTRRTVGAQAAMPSMGGTTVVHATTHLSLLGQPDDHTMLVLEQAQMRTAARVGRRVAGGRG